ncbi:MAG: sulfotransferase domain-containing protein [Pirellula sp.]
MANRVDVRDSGDISQLEPKLCRTQNLASVSSNAASSNSSGSLPTSDTTSDSTSTNSNSESPSDSPSSGQSPPTSTSQSADPSNSLSDSLIDPPVSTSLSAVATAVAHYATPPEARFDNTDRDQYATYIPGPGSELRKMIGWLTPADSDLTQDPLAQNKLVAVMNGLGAEGCKAYLTELTNGLLTEAAQRGMNHEDVTPAIAKSLILTANDEQLTKQLKAWVVARKSEAVRDRTVAGGKYPHLCRFARHLHTAIGPSLRIIAVDRPIEASIRSLQDRSRRHPGEWFAASDVECERLQCSLLEYRESFIREHPDVPVHRIDFAKLTEDPEGEILRLIDFLGIEPTLEEINSAVSHVNPQLRKFG